MEKTGSPTLVRFWGKGEGLWERGLPVYRGRRVAPDPGLDGAATAGKSRKIACHLAPPGRFSSLSSRRRRSMTS